MSLGKANVNVLCGRKLRFKGNVIKGFKKLDTNRLFFCQFLSLRGSSFDEIDVNVMLFLFFIDIAWTKIKLSDFRSSISLQKVVYDSS